MKLNCKRFIYGLMCAVLPISIFVNTLGIVVPTIDIIAVSFVMTLGLMGIFQKNKMIRIISLVLVVIYTLYCYIGTDFNEGMKILTERFNEFLKCYNEGKNIDYEIIEPIAAANVVKMYLCIMIPCLVVIYKSRFWKLIYIVISMPFLVLIMAIGLFPTTFQTYMLAFMYLNILSEGREIKGNFDLSTKKVEVVKTLVMNVIIIIVFCIIGIWNQANPYVRPEKFDEYKNEINAYVSGKKTFELANLIDFLKFGKDKGNGGLSRGKLGRFDKLEFSGEEVLRVSSPDIYAGEMRYALVQAMYLKSYVGVNYDGSSWSTLGSDATKKAENIVSKYGKKLADLDEIPTYLCDCADTVLWNDGYVDKYRLTIEMLNNDTDIYTPTYAHSPLDESKEGIRDANGTDTKSMSYDTYTSVNIPSKELMEEFNAWLKNYPYYEYEKSYYNDIAGKNFKNKDIIEMEKEYRGYVYANYLDIPENLVGIADELRSLQIKVGYTSYNNYNTYNISLDKYLENIQKNGGYKPIIEAVKEYLSNKCEYNLEPGRLEDGEDFILKFLNETNKGYCMHFASAAVMLFRDLGIPARYVEGYCVTSDATEDSQGVVVRDDSAHAWVEIYVDGVGFMTVEATPAGYRREIAKYKKNGNNTPETEKKETTSQLETDTSKETTTAPVETTKINQETTTVKETKDTGNGGIGGGDSGNKTNSVRIKKVVITFFVVAIIGGIILASILGRYNLKIKKYDAIRAGKSNKLKYKTFILQVRYCMKKRRIKVDLVDNEKLIANKLCECLNDSEYEKCKEVAKIIIKYNFSNEGIHDEEADCIVQFAQMMNDYTYINSNFVAKIRMKFFKCLYLSKK